MRSRYDGNVILLTAIGISTLLVALVGAAFGYFSANVSNANAKSIVVQLAPNTVLEYTSGQIILMDAIPGNSSKSKFTVSNVDKDYIHSYDLSFVIDLNTFNNTQGDKQLIVSIIPESNLEEGAIIPSIPEFSEFDVTDSRDENLSENFSGGNGRERTIPMLVDQRIGKLETHTYNVDISFNELNDNQDSNNESVFSAHIQISNEKIITEELN